MRQQSLPGIDPPACEAPQPGTYKGYRWHQNHAGGASACDACREANRVKLAEWKSRPGGAEAWNAYMRSYNQDPDHNARRSEKRREQWGDKDYRDAVNANRRAERKDPVKGPQVRARDRERRSDPEYRARVAAEQRERRAFRWGTAIEAIEARDGRDCRYCGADRSGFKPTIDHVWPGAKGADRSYKNVGNLVIACQTCNSSKHDDWLWDWIARPCVADWILPSVYEMAEELRQKVDAVGVSA